MFTKQRTAALFVAGALLTAGSALSGAMAAMPGLAGAPPAMTEASAPPAAQQVRHRRYYYRGHRYDGYFAVRRVCHRHRRVIRVWSRRHHRWVRRVVLGPRHCHVRRVWVR